jgi:peptidoglycan/xylan/chitin deacetylase (PgdA/CDA1 family)
MVNGVLAQRDPNSVRSIHERGHEIVNHSWGMDVIPVYFDEAQEKANIERNHQILTQVSGIEPKGWISPRGTGSAISAKLLAQYGYTHHGDCNDDDRPYVKSFGDKRIVCIPLTMDVNDLPTSIRYGHSPRHMLEAFEDTFSAMMDRETAPLMLDVTAHTHVFGRPSGAWVFDEIMAQMHSRSDIWVTTRKEMADYVLSTSLIKKEWLMP